MSSRSHDPSHSHAKIRGGEPRARSLPFRGPFILAGFLSAIHYLSIIAWLTVLVMFAFQQNVAASKMVLYSMCLVIVTWFVAFIKRRGARCPLCKGTPLLNSGALPHGKAFRIPPLNYGTTATLSLICTQEYRCMYCGNLFDLLKPVPLEKRASRD